MKPKPEDTCRGCKSRRMTGWFPVFGTDLIRRECRDCGHAEDRQTGKIVKDPRTLQ